MTHAHRWLPPIARLGYTARGVVYAIIGLFAVLAADGRADETDSEGALQTLLAQPFGRVLVGAMILGLVGYALWRCVQAILDADNHGHGPKALAIRAGLLVAAVTYVTLALYSLSLLGFLSGGDGGGGGGADRGAFSRTIDQFVGEETTSALLAAVLAGVAAAHFAKAIRRGYEKHLRPEAARSRAVHLVSRLGLSARGFTFAVIAFLLVQRALAGDAEGASSAPGLADALNYVRSLPFGQALLALTGLGLIAFALYSFAEARWRRIDVPESANLR